MLTVKAEHLKDWFKLSSDELFVAWPKPGTSPMNHSYNEPVESANYILAPLFDIIVTAFVEELSHGMVTPEVTDLQRTSHGIFDTPTYNVVTAGKIVGISFRQLDIDHYDEDESIMVCHTMILDGDETACRCVRDLFLDFAKTKSVETWKLDVVESLKNSKTYHLKSELSDFYWGADNGA